MSSIPNNQKIVQIDSKRIKAAAEKSGLSTRAIAEQAGGITHTTVFDILNGNTSPSAVNVKKVCNVLGVAIEDAFIEEKAAA